VTETFSVRNSCACSREIGFSAAGVEQARRHCARLEELRRNLVESASGSTNPKKDYLTSRPHCTTCLRFALRRASPVRVLAV
jgi:hypothetical protein